MRDVHVFGGVMCVSVCVGGLLMWLSYHYIRFLLCGAQCLWLLTRTNSFQRCPMPSRGIAPQWLLLIGMGLFSERVLMRMRMMIIDNILACMHVCMCGGEGGGHRGEGGQELPWHIGMHT